MANAQTAPNEPARDAKAHGAAAPDASPLLEAIAIMARLRGPDGCPWDREQTFDTIKRHTLEETYEVFDAIERRAWPELKDELGDLLLQVLFYAQMAAEAGYFDIAGVAESLNAKLVRRHPHIFPVNGELADAKTAEAVLRNWDEIKRTEKTGAAKDAVEASGLDEIPRTMPAMLEARKIGSRAAKVGFDWPDVGGILLKLEEEIAELRVELAEGSDAERLHDEVGDVLFTAVNLARHLDVDPESALRGANAKFRSRFRAMEKVAGGYEALKSLDPARLDNLWNRAKVEAGRDADGSKGTTQP